MQFAETIPENIEQGEFDPPGIVLSPELDYSHRVEVRGKFLFLGDEKYWV